MILPCGQSAVQTKRGQTALIRSHRATNQLTHPYHGCNDNALVRGRHYSVDWTTGLTETASGGRKKHQCAELRHPATKFVAVL